MSAKKHSKLRAIGGPLWTRWRSGWAAPRSWWAGQEDRQDTKNTPTLALQERRGLLLRARCPVDKRPLEPRTRHSFPQIWPQCVRCTFYNFLAPNENGIKLFRQERCRGSREKTRQRRNLVGTSEGQVRQAPALGAVQLQARKLSVKTCWEAEIREAKRR